MPIYEYRCVEDGTLISLIRPMSDADAPVEDPEGHDRTFERVQSLFSVDASKPTVQPNQGGCCGGGCGCAGH